MCNRPNRSEGVCKDIEAICEAAAQSEVSVALEKAPALFCCFGSMSMTHTFIVEEGLELLQVYRWGRRAGALVHWKLCTLVTHAVSGLTRTGMLFK